ncbi:MAG: hypothetical protein ACOCQD_00280 [archaeon]
MAYYTPYMTPNGKLAVKRVVKNGRAQQMFKQNIVPEMTRCTQKARGVSDVTERKKIFSQCAKNVAKPGTKEKYLEYTSK